MERKREATGLLGSGAASGPRPLAPGLPHYLQPGDLPSYGRIGALMANYTCARLTGMTEGGLRARLSKLMSAETPDFARVSDLTIQRRQSIKFAWGHDHDFGSFQLRGQMGERHIKHLAVFHDCFRSLPLDLSGKRVLDVGCWTGGVSLLLAACGAEVVAIDEVGKYCEALNLLCEAFEIGNVRVENISLYDLRTSQYDDYFDFVIFAGVLYHLSDVIVATRILFNLLKDGGLCLVESTGFPAQRPVFGFQRRQWNWFDPSPPALAQLLQDVGFRHIKVGPVTPDRRLYAVGTRVTHVDMRRDGLSMPTIR